MLTINLISVEAMHVFICYPNFIFISSFSLSFIESAKMEDNE